MSTSASFKNAGKAGTLTETIQRLEAAGILIDPNARAFLNQVGESGQVAATRLCTFTDLSLRGEEVPFSRLIKNAEKVGLTYSLPSVALDNILSSVGRVKGGGADRIYAPLVTGERGHEVLMLKKVGGEVVLLLKTFLRADTVKIVHLTPTVKLFLFSVR